MYFDFTTLEIILASLIISFLTTFFALPYVQKFGIDFNIKDTLDARKQKQNSLVRIGGLALIVGFLSSLLVISILKNFSYTNLYSTKTLITLLFSALTFFILGFVDDIKSLSPFIRLLIQVLIALLISGSGITIEKIDLAWINISPIYLPSFLSMLITTFWIVGLTNAINWLDGIDGLASGITGISSLGLTIISYQNGQSLVPILAASISGCSFGFLRFNFFPAKMLMGDSGSYFLGFSLAIISILSTNVEINPIGIFIPIFLFTIPLLDMFMVIIGRIIKKESPFIADRSHLHHKLIDSGYSELGTVILIYSISQWIAVVTTGLASINDGVYILAVLLSSVLLFFGFILSKYVL